MDGRRHKRDRRSGRSQSPERDGIRKKVGFSLFVLEIVSLFLPLACSLARARPCSRLLIPLHCSHPESAVTFQSTIFARGSYTQHLFWRGRDRCHPARTSFRQDLQYFDAQTEKSGEVIVRRYRVFHVSCLLKNDS